MAKKGKISVATIAGLSMTLSHLYQKWKLYDNDTDRPNRSALMSYHMSGFASKSTAERIGVNPGFDSGVVADTWLPTIAGSLISKFVGGPKGLNVNAQLKALPIFKL